MALLYLRCDERQSTIIFDHFYRVVHETSGFWLNEWKNMVCEFACYYDGESSIGVVRITQYLHCFQSSTGYIGNSNKTISSCHHKLYLLIEESIDWCIPVYCFVYFWAAMISVFFT